MTLATVTVLLLGALPAFLLIREVTRDPVVRSLDQLAVPSWAARNPVDAGAGSRWCVGTCRVRWRTWESDRGIADTRKVYASALARQGWRPWRVSGCEPEAVGEEHACYRRDEYTLDLLVRPDCRATAQGCTVARVAIRVQNRTADARGR